MNFDVNLILMTWWSHQSKTWSSVGDEVIQKDNEIPSICSHYYYFYYRKSYYFILKRKKEKKKNLYIPNAFRIIT